MPEEKTLSEREEQILRLVATGMTNREIAQELTISPNTVKVHLRNVFEKIGVASRTEATLYGIEHGIVSMPGNGGPAGEPSELGPESFWKKYLWAWVPSLVVLVGVLVYIIFGTNLIFQWQGPTPEELQMLAEVQDRWVELAPMPEPRAGLAGTAYDGKIYAIAGEGPEGVSGSVFRYLPEEDLWESLADKPTPVRDVKAVLIGEKIFVPGGKLANGAPTSILEVYDPRANTWTEGASLPQPISAYALADFEGQMYLFGGWDGEKALDVVYVYDPQEDNWREGTQMPTARLGAGAAALADKIVVVGGRNEESIFKEAWAYFPPRDRVSENPWESFRDLPQPLANFGIANISDAIFIVGIFNYSDETLRKPIGYQLLDNEWVELLIAEDFLPGETILLSLRSKLFVLSSDEIGNKISFWQYQAYYYEIYLPIVD